MINAFTAIGFNQDLISFFYEHGNQGGCIVLEQRFATRDFHKMTGVRFKFFKNLIKAHNLGLFFRIKGVTP
jgi:hypothetical protein